MVLNKLTIIFRAQAVVIRIKHILANNLESCEVPFIKEISITAWKQPIIISLKK